MGKERKDPYRAAGVPRRKFINGFLGGSCAAVAAAVVYPILEAAS